MNDFERHYLDLLARTPVAEASCFELPGNVPPWTDTGIDLQRGEHVSLIATGTIEWAPGAGLFGGAGQHLWGRIGDDGPIFNLPRSSRTLEVARDGRLFLAIYQGEWASPRGDLATPVEAYALQQGSLDACLLRWKDDPADGLAALCAAAPDDTPLAAELARLRSPIQRPPGWEYLWFLGEQDIFSVDGDCIEVDAQSEVGILQKRVDFPLDDATRVHWRWCMDELASAVAENSVPTHDYVSLAVEFSNGLDLTWYWSATLPEHTHYTCPLPNWDQRETHWVLHSGSKGLGEWHDEARPILADYREAIGGEDPDRIVGVWLIAVSFFQRGRARGRFSDIVLTSEDARLPI